MYETSFLDRGHFLILWYKICNKILLETFAEVSSIFILSDFKSSTKSVYIHDNCVGN